MNAATWESKRWMGIIALVITALVILPGTAHAALPLGDIVFVIDESGSMADDQADVSARVKDISDQLGASLDYTLGLVGFGASSGGNPVIEQTLTSDATQFKAAVDGLTASGGFEPGGAAMSLAMSDAMGYREGAGVCAILISDEDADDPGQLPQAITDAQARGATFYGIVQPGAGATDTHYGPDPGSLAAETGGEVFSILDFRQDATPVLNAVINGCIRAVSGGGDAVDVHPTSCPNPFRLGSRGWYPAAIVGTDSVDVTTIDPGSIRLSGPGGDATPTHWAIEDVTTPYEGTASADDRDGCTTDGADGTLDLTVKFTSSDVQAALGSVQKGDVVLVTLSASTFGGSAISGQDVVWIV